MINNSRGLLIKPASSLCTLRCEYCFYHDIASKRETKSHGIMNDETLDLLCRKALEDQPKSISFAFQGGEPTMAGLDFYRRLLEYQKKYNKGSIISNSIQTNGYGLDEEWAKFFAENDFLVGVSIDGTKDIHNTYRKTASGDDSFNDIMNTIALFNSYGVKYNILTVVTRAVARKPEKIYNFYKRSGFKYLQFIPCMDKYGENIVERYSLTPDDYASFMMKLFDLWFEDLLKGDNISIRQFDNYVEMAAGLPPESCGMSGVCTVQCVVEADGSVYPCDFYVLDEYRLGNIHDSSFAELETSTLGTDFINNSRILPAKCRQCRIVGICRNGCARYRDADGINIHCEAYKKFFAHAGGRISRLAQLLKANISIDKLQ